MSQTKQTETKTPEGEEAKCCGCDTIVDDEDDYGNNADVADTCCKECWEKHVEEEDGWEEECNQCNEVLDESTGREWIEQLGCLCTRCYDLRKDDFPLE